jgi:hypothetical protein
LRKGATDEEIVRWGRAYDVVDRLDAGIAEVVEDHSDLDRLLEEALHQNNTAQLRVRIPAAMKAVLQRLARQRTTDATTLARIWLAERLERELRRHSPASP